MRLGRNPHTGSNPVPSARSLFSVHRAEGALIDNAGLEKIMRFLECHDSRSRELAKILRRRG